MTRYAQPVRHIVQRSIEMYTMQEALAREHLRVDERYEQQRRVAQAMSAARRWHRLEQRAGAVRRRHVHRAT